MAYNRNPTWRNWPDKTTPITSAELENIETGIVNAATQADAAVAALPGKSDVGHNHDDRYYTETETDGLLAGKSSTGHVHVASQVTDLDNWIVSRQRPIDPTSPVYGAVGDGTTDDTAALQAAINAGNVILPRRTFKITGPLTVPDGRSITGSGERESIIFTNTDVSAFTWSGGQAQSLRNLLIRSWFVGARSNFDIDVVNPTKPVLEDIEIDLATGSSGNGGIRFTGNDGVAGNHFMPQLQRVWVRNGRFVVSGVSDGHVADCYFWGNNNDGLATVDFSSVADGWSFNNVDVVPGTGAGAGYLFTNTNNINISGGYLDGSYNDVMTGHGIKAVNSGRIFVAATRLYNLGRSGIYLQNTHGCSFSAIGFLRCNKQDGSYPDIDLVSSTGNTFLGSSHAQPVARTNKGGIYREDSASTNNNFDAASLDQSLGNNYAGTIFSGNAKTRGQRCKPESLWPRHWAAPSLLSPPSATLSLPNAATWPAANTAIAQRFTVQVGAVYTNAHFQVDTGSGNMQAAVVKLATDGVSWTRVMNSGIVACTNGQKTLSLGSAFLDPGEYALVLWCDNTTAQWRVGSTSGLAASWLTAEWVDAAGVGVSGTMTWGSSRHVGGATLTT